MNTSIISTFRKICARPIPYSCIVDNFKRIAESEKARKKARRKKPGHPYLSSLVTKVQHHNELISEVPQMSKDDEIVAVSRFWKKHANAHWPNQIC
ncbi:MAG: hypothetical protein KJO80_13580 [Gammaproteobacteria bacterium]|nr:hypothetical protein [Gammaproteobacteria bacterium]